MRLLYELASKKFSNIEDQMVMVKGSLHYFIAACEEQKCDSDIMFTTLLLLLDDSWGNLFDKQYSEKLRDCYDLAKSDMKNKRNLSGQLTIPRRQLLIPEGYSPFRPELQPRFSWRRKELERVVSSRTRFCR